MNLNTSYWGGTFDRLIEVLGPPELFGTFALWSVPRPGGGTQAIKVWARSGGGQDLCRVWVFYPGTSDDRDAEEFRIQTPEQLEDLLKRVGFAALRGRGKSAMPGRDPAL
jgi:hypothetical protein